VRGTVLIVGTSFLVFPFRNATMSSAVPGRTLATRRCLTRARRRAGRRRRGRRRLLVQIVCSVYKRQHHFWLTKLQEYEKRVIIFRLSNKRLELGEFTWSGSTANCINIFTVATAIRANQPWLAGLVWVDLGVCELITQVMFL